MPARPRRVGLLGGSFDPPHEGHLWMARRAREALDLDEVWLLPAHRPPHKSGERLAPYPARLAMTELLAAEEPFLSVCRVEEELPAPGYTARTLEALSQREGDGVRFTFILGEDSLANLENWFEPDRVFALAEVAVLAREGFEAESDRPLRWIRGETHPAQSTRIRAQLRRGERPGHLPAPVLDYLLGEGLYAGEEGP